MSDCSKPQTSDPRPAKTPKISNESHLLRLVNSARAELGAPPLKADRQATDIARTHARRMSSRGYVFHNPKMRTTSGRRSLGLPAVSGENVGVGPDLQAIHRAFMGSGGHRSQILSSSYRTIGLGIVVDAHEVWVTEVFVGSGSRHRASASAEKASGEPADVAPMRTPNAEIQGVYGSTGNDDTVVLGINPVEAKEEFPWLALSPSLALAGWLAVRRRGQRRAWD